jgi:hypothetical protein
MGKMGKLDAESKVAVAGGCLIVFAWLVAVMLSLGLTAAIIYGVVELAMWLGRH